MQVASSLSCSQRVDAASDASPLCAQARSSEYRLARRNLKILMMAAPLVRSQSNTLLLLTKAMAKFVDVRPPNTWMDESVS